MAVSTAQGTLNAAWNGVGTAPAGSVLQLSVAELAAISVQVTGTFTATILLEATIDGTTWFAPNVLTLAKAAGSATITGTGQSLVQIAAYTAVRARMSAFTSGSAVVTFAGSLSGV
jgi:hypothetical protein